MGVEIDEPGRDDETRDGERLPRHERVSGHRRNPAVPDAHVATSVQAGLRVEHAPAHEREIVGLSLRPRAARRERDRAEQDH